MKKNICVLFCISIILSIIMGCGGNSVKKSGSPMVTNVFDSIKDENFMQFIEHFHNDSLFAMSRLCDTIIGINTDTHEFDSILDDFVMDTIWCKDSIPNYYPFLNEFKKTDGVITEYDSTGFPMQEYIYMPESSCYIKLRFVRKEHKWFLCGFDFAFL